MREIHEELWIPWDEEMKLRTWLFKNNIKNVKKLNKKDEKQQNLYPYHRKSYNSIFGLPTFLGYQHFWFFLPFSAINI